MSGIILSHFQASALLAAIQKGMPALQVSPDLGLSRVEVSMDADGAIFPGGQPIAVELLKDISASPSSCFLIQEGGCQPVQFYSHETERLYSLYPTQGAPSMLVSGIPMHRVKDTDPHQDTLEKIRAIKPLVGQVLDTATGLGYTAIQASLTAEHVTTIELDPMALEVCRLNPWSQRLFNNPRITQLIGDSFDVVAGMETASFTRVIHDPPAFALAGDLYSADFYRQLFRVMRNHARLFHYVGDPESKSGRSITAGVMRRLEAVGFSQVSRAPQAFGVVAVR